MDKHSKDPMFTPQGLAMIAALLAMLAWVLA
jgi:hypothetical protein